MTDKISQEDAAEAIRLLRATNEGSLLPTSSLFRPVRALLAKYPPGPALQPCPFCGGVNAVVEERLADYRYAVAGFHVVCGTSRGGCGAETRRTVIEAEAVRVWNRRP